jgi:hypothetical protein
VSYSELIIGAALFDLSGLPVEYFVAVESQDISWVQAIFQALGLQSLLVSSLQLEGFRYVVLHGKAYRAIVLKQKPHYLALLIQRNPEDLPETFFKWAQVFDPGDLKSDPRFSTV